MPPPGQQRRPAGWPAALAFACACALGACAGTSPVPSEIAAREIPAVTVSEAERTEAERFERDALQALTDRSWQEAQRLADAALSIDPRRARARAAYGLATFELGGLVDPPDLFLQNRGDGETAAAVRLAPNDPLVALLRGRMLAGTGHLSAAAAAAEACLPLLLAPDPAEHRALLEAAAEWRYELGEERAALPHLRALAAMDGTRAITWFRIGHCLLRRAEAPASDASAAQTQRRTSAVDAAAAFARCAELSPGDDDAHFAVVTAWARAAELARDGGDTEAAARNLAAARAAADAAAQRFADLGEGPFRVGVVAERQGLPDEAAAAYREALRREPGHAGALLNLAWLRAADGAAGQEEAVALWQRALALGDALTAGERRRVEVAIEAASRRP